MSLSFEVLLLMGIIGFYLYDSAMLLYVDEMVLGENGHAWFAACPAGQWTIRGRHPYLPNPLTPANPIFRLAWSFNATSPDQPALDEIKKLIDAMRPLRYLSIVLLVVMLIWLPVLTFRFGIGIGFFVSLALTYSTILSMLALIYRRRAVLSLSKKDFYSLAFDAVACPPFAINLVRKISLHQKMKVDPVMFAHQSLTKEKFSSLVRAIQSRLETEMHSEEEGSAKFAEIQAFHDRLDGLAV